MKEAGCALVGGHSIRLPEPVYGLSVTGLVNPRRVIANTAAKAGDLLVLTKPLGTGITTTAIKRGLASDRLAARATRAMRMLNTVGTVLAERDLVRAGTDVTGFGFFGHLGNVLRGSGVGAEIDAAAVPILGEEVLELIGRDCVPGGTRTNLEAAAEFVDFHHPDPRRMVLLADAQTSGGLLLCVPPKRLEEVLTTLAEHHTLCAAVVGRIVRSGPRVVVR